MSPQSRRTRSSNLPSTFRYVTLAAVALALTLTVSTRASAQDAAPADTAPPSAEAAAAEATPPPPPEAPTLPTPEDDENPLVIHGVTFTPYAQVRPRLELRGTFPNVGQTVGAFVLNRARFGVRAEWESLEVHIQMQDVRQWGDHPPQATDNGGFFGLHQGYVGISGDLGYIRLGRQEVNYGDQRMIGALNWSNGGRSFDSARAHGVFLDGKLEVDSVFAFTGSQRLNTGPTVDAEGDYMATLYATYDVADWMDADLYVLYRHDGGSEAAPTRDNNIIAYGARLNGDHEGLGYTTEVTIEYGSTEAPGSGDFFAWAASADVGYTFLDSSWSPNVRGGFAIASGADGDTNEFNNFYPTNHKFYGINDLFGLRNLIEGHLRVTATAPDAPVRLYAEVLQFGLQTDAGRWSNAGGATVGTIVPGASRNLGTEIDGVVAWRILDGLSLSGGYGAFIPQSGAEARGVTDVAHFGYLMLDAKTP